jgi:hypothetical protein
MKSKKRSTRKRCGFVFRGVKCGLNANHKGGHVAEQCSVESQPLVSIDRPGPRRDAEEALAKFGA